MSNDQRLKLKNMGRLQRTCIIICMVYVVAAALFYYAAAMDWDVQASDVRLMNADHRLGVLTGDVMIEQVIVPQTSTIDRVEPYFDMMGDVAEKSVTVELVQNDQVLGSKTILLSEVAVKVFQPIAFDAPVAVEKGKNVIVRITMENLVAENAVTVYYGNSVMTAKNAITLPEDTTFTMNGDVIHGALAINIIGRSYYNMSRTYLLLAVAGFVLLVGTMILQIRKFRKHESTFLIRIMVVLDRYSYLMKQMVSRDFHVKYKRSVLGVVWSFLNPLLTMAVQYFVFSKLFGQNTENYLVYLLTGIVTFNYFNEAASTGLNSIVGNASLITKVYVPKFIYPVIPVFSSTINMLFSLIPLIGVMMLSGTAFTKALLLLPIGIMFIMIFSIGMSMILSTSMVFFRDTKFLWGVISMLWNFLTPIFYMESIIPARFIGLYHMNPMYQFVYFMRTIIIGGVSPNPITYVYCIVVSVVPLLVGLFMFRRYQNKFVFNL